MKTCSKCKEVKPLADFHRNRAKSDGRASYCKPCMKIRNYAYYRNTPERNTQRQASRERSKAAARTLVWSYLTSHPCVDCGNPDPVVLEFDHVRGEKVRSISEMVCRGTSAAIIEEEIAKCEVRCANCHRRATALRGSWWTVAPTTNP